MVDIKTGSFIGNDTVNVTLNIGFEPDVIIIDSNLDFETAGWIGTRNIIILKDSIIYISRHNNTTNTTALVSTGWHIGGSYNSFGEGDQAYIPYGRYLNGIMQISNPTDLALTRFILNQVYTWKAIKFN